MSAATAGRSRVKLASWRSLLWPVRLLRDRSRLLKSGLFDPTWYRSRSGGGRVGPWASLHYLCFGARNGLDPHALFNVDWYGEENPDVRQRGIDPLLHYLFAGAAEGRDPNPYFSSSYYLAAYQDVAAVGTNPLVHYVRYGAKEGRRPSPKFDPAFYARQLPPADATSGDLLVHYITVGRAAGLVPSIEGGSLIGDPVEWSRLQARKRWLFQSGRRVALFVTHAPNGHIRAHVRFHLAALRKANIDPILIVATEAMPQEEGLFEELVGFYTRDNAGFDFAAWAHLLKTETRLWDCDEIYLLNDSVLGPVAEAAYNTVLARAEASSADIVGLTDSREKGWHLQSYFLMLRASALRNPRLQSFFNAVRTQKDKQAVIDGYEVGFSVVALEAGLKLEALFPSATGENMTLFGWRALLDGGFPFLKTSVAAGRFADVDPTGWRERLAEVGFPIALADDVLRPLAPANRGSDRIPYQPQRSPTGVSFYGPFNFDNGLGQASRGYLSALFRLKRPLNAYSLTAPFHIHRRRSPGRAVRDFVEPADVAVVHLNPDSWHLLSSEQRKEIERARLRVGLWVWEMDAVPDFFAPNFESVDAIWTPSAYCARVFANATDRPVLVVPHVVALTPLRAQPTERMILYIFDGSSYLARKNPEALVLAFALTPLSRRGWRLVLKTKHLGDAAEGDLKAEALRTLCREVPGVDLVDRSMPQEAMQDLFASASIYASSHASEGFGLTIAEAMAAGKIVVATDYGGPQDFLDESCGFPVRCDVVTLPESYGHYRAGGRWAAVDIDAFAASLEQAAELVEGGNLTVGQAARARIESQLSAASVARRVEAALEAIAAPFSPAGSL